MELPKTTFYIIMTMNNHDSMIQKKIKERKKEIVGGEKKEKEEKNTRLPLQRSTYSRSNQYLSSPHQKHLIIL